MSYPLLVTKLFIPTTRSELVSRPRLLSQLDRGLRRKLTLISAPAGFGKTTLVTEWLQTKGDDISSPCVVAWFSLDEGDNDPVRFLTYFISALKQCDGVDSLGDEALTLLEAAQPPPPETVLTALINEVAGLPGRIILILDDYHLIDVQPVHDALNFVLDNLPPQLHLIITTREDPLLPLSRLRARNQLSEIRAADLRFTLSEAAEFLNQSMGLNLLPDDVAALEARTEGWIAGLQLAAISLQGQADISKLIQTFTGSHRLVLDYLIEEVIERQPEHIQTFLLQTAILKRFTAPLCDMVTGQENSQTTLESLDRANLFVIPLDNQREWYRYHHLFAELLGQRLRVKYPDLINGLHEKAVDWYETNNFLSEAIEHAFAGDDIAAVVRIIEKGSLDALAKSDFGFILKAVERIPETALESSPWLFVYHSWALCLTGHINIVAPKFENTDWLLESLSDADEADKQKMLGYIAGLKVQLTAWQRDYSNIKRYNDQVKMYLPARHWILGYCAMMMGVYCWDHGNLAAAIEVFNEAADIGRVTGNKRVAVTSAIYLGHALELEGHLQKAVQVFQNAFRVTEQNGRELPVACYLHIDLARVLYELNELELANQHLTIGIKQSQLLADDRIEDIAYGLLARVYLASGDIEQAAHSISNSQKFIPSPGIMYDMRGGEYPEIRYWLKQNMYQEIKRWLDGNIDIVGSSGYFKFRMSDTMIARVYITLAREYHNESNYLLRAQDLLAELLEMAEGNGWGYKVIEILGLQALASEVEGKTESALSTLEQAIAFAEPERFVRVFVDEGRPMARLLYQLLSRSIAVDYVQRLLAAFPDIKPEQPKPMETQSVDGEWIEPLSERELEILQLIAEGLTNSEIASHLYLSLNTVKAHTRNIFGKLDVHNRTQAIARSHALGLLSGKN